MRDIKCRAWKKMCGFAFFRLGIKPMWNGEYSENHGYYFTGVENADKVDQFTGLKDKNGVDSYHSDLCVHSYEVDSDVFCGEKKELLLIAWDDEDFRWCFRDAFNGDFYCNLADLKSTEFEIIGNIHENSELMEAERGVD